MSARSRFGLLALLGSIALGDAGAAGPAGTPAAPETAAGKAIYLRKCAHCHGAGGKGDGPAAERLDPRPRDFTRGRFKIRSTPSRQLPTDADLFEVITRGMPGTSMPGWGDLSAGDRRKLVAYIKTFSRQFARAGGPPEEMDMGDKVPFSEESVARGRQVYKTLECAKCHGLEGRGDGPSALSLVDEWNDPIRPADLTQSWNFRGGASTEELYRRFVSGLAGTPMPSITESFVVPEEIEEISIKIEDGEALSPEEREQYSEAMRRIRTRTWDLANYVRSLSPEEKPRVEIVLRSRRVEGEVPRRLDDPRWDEVEPNFYPLAGQVIVEPRNFTPSIGAIYVKSMYDGDEIAFLLSWDDPSLSFSSPVDSGAPDPAGAERRAPYDDALALQFPVELGEGPERPYFLMGDERRRVYVWFWKSSDSFGPQSRSGRIPRVEEGNAKGMTRFTVQGIEGQSTRGEAAYDQGRYRLLIRRALRTEDRNDLQFEVGRFIPMAFSAWDGSSGESGTRRSVSTWYYLLLERPASNKGYVFALSAAVLALVFEGMLTRSVRRRRGRRD